MVNLMDGNLIMMINNNILERVFAMKNDSAILSGVLGVALLGLGLATAGR